MHTNRRNSQPPNHPNHEGYGTASTFPSLRGHYDFKDLGEEKAIDLLASMPSQIPRLCSSPVKAHLKKGTSQCKFSHQRGPIFHGPQQLMYVDTATLTSEAQGQVAIGNHGQDPMQQAATGGQPRAQEQTEPAGSPW